MARRDLGKRLLAAHDAGERFALPPRAADLSAFPPFAGRWQAVSPLGTNPSDGLVIWLLRCVECGARATRTSGSIKKQHLPWCRKCQGKPSPVKLKPGTAPDGYADDSRSERAAVKAACPSLYQAWEDAQTRCYGNGHGTYKAKGTVMCLGYRHSVRAMLDDLGPRPEPEGGKKITCDRIDNDGMYSCGKCPQCLKEGWPMNLRWATWKVQRNNRSDSPQYAGKKAAA